MTFKPKNNCDLFTQHYMQYLDGTYDCVDRIVINAYFILGQTGGGFRTWWRRLMGDDAGARGPVQGFNDLMFRHL